MTQTPTSTLLTDMNYYAPEVEEDICLTGLEYITSMPEEPEYDTLDIQQERMDRETEYKKCANLPAIYIKSYKDAHKRGCGVWIPLEYQEQVRLDIIKFLANVSKATKEKHERFVISKVKGFHSPMSWLRKSPIDEIIDEGIFIGRYGKLARLVLKRIPGNVLKSYVLTKDFRETFWREEYPSQQSWERAKSIILEKHEDTQIVIDDDDECVHVLYADKVKGGKEPDWWRDAPDPKTRKDKRGGPIGSFHINTLSPDHIFRYFVERGHDVCDIFNVYLPF